MEILGEWKAFGVVSSIGLVKTQGYIYEKKKSCFFLGYLKPSKIIIIINSLAFFEVIGRETDIILLMFDNGQASLLSYDPALDELVTHSLFNFAEIIRGKCLSRNTKQLSFLNLPSPNKN